MNLLLLHGAIGSAEQLLPLANKFSDTKNVHTLNFSGHGGNKIPQKNFSIELFANDVLNWMQENSIAQTNIFGYSMGGYVALYLARFHPEKVGRIITLATKFDWTEEGSQRAAMLDPENLQTKLPDFAETLRKRHNPSDWKEVLTKTQGMMIDLGKNNALTSKDFSQIEHKVTLMIGANDKMVNIDETEKVSRELRNGNLIVLPETKHPIEAVNLNLIFENISGSLS